ncbi:rod shape-determining protein [Hyphococcus flavus]|uniref:Rod shape-determining protein n=1 Tax=Hyphococcus flavus TaxID=1866326 RepID=A0AAF0CGU3_9PROT|nr:rod shape-determining protein [Hyphococcus flavus]WDI32653.1 rod shape-determining protein [Hyphococcus flavus]
MWLFHALSGRFPIVLGSIGKDRIALKWLQTGAVFDEPPLIAIENKAGGKYVKAVGASASGMSGLHAVTVHNSFESIEPLFTDYDLAAALVKHAIREIFEARWLMSPKVLLRICGRHSVLSGSEKQMLQRFAKDCGIARLYVFLEGETIPGNNEMNHSSLSKSAHFVTKFVA